MKIGLIDVDTGRASGLRNMIRSNVLDRSAMTDNLTDWRRVYERGVDVEESG